MTRRTREPTDEERELFRETMGEPRRPLKPAATQKRENPKRETPAASAKTSARRGETGLDGRTSERLRKGELEPELRLDLHGLTEAAAHRALAQFVKSAHRNNVRLVLVVTGKGSAGALPDAPFDLGLDGHARGVLKAMTPRWLAAADLAPMIAAVRAAHRKHGGSGALYVYLRKSRR